MILFNALGKLGRLGNQLWQIASTIGIAQKNGHEYGFPEWNYSKYFVNKLPLAAEKQKSSMLFEDGFEYLEYSIEKNYHFDLRGYFQSYKYFSTFTDQIKKQFTFNEVFAKHTKEKFNHYGKRTIGIHIRRGDYVGNPSHYNLPIGYYINALESIPYWKECNILIFSDDMEFAKWHFMCLPNVYFSQNSDIEDLYLLSQCDDFIIANSSFSWWGAWLGEKEDSIIIRPKQHFAGKLLKHDIKDLYPNHWQVIDATQKVYLNDVSFIIPVALDHNDRMRNLNIITYHLHSNFTTNLMIKEWNGDSFSYTSEYAAYSRLTSRNFHRTKMINDCVKECNTPFAANYDADVLINPVQLWYSVVLLRDGKDIVYPYDGMFCHVGGDYIAKVKENMHALIGKLFYSATESFGGCLLFNCKSFMDAGGENENFVSFGPEDAERFHRFLKIGLQVIRVKGSLYHLEHYRGINSSKQNPFIESNRAEWRKIQALSINKLKEYIETWTWKH